MREENTTFDNNFVNFSLNVTKCGLLIDIVDIDKSHDFGCYGNHPAVLRNICSEGKLTEQVRKLHIKMFKFALFKE